MCVDKNDNIVTVGTTIGSFTGNSNVGSYDVLVAHYNEEGDILSVKQFTTLENETAVDMLIDKNNDVIVVGTLSTGIVMSKLLIM